MTEQADNEPRDFVFEVVQFNLNQATNVATFVVRDDEGHEYERTALLNTPALQEGLEAMRQMNPQPRPLADIGRVLANVFSPEIIATIEQNPDRLIRTTIRLQKLAPEISLFPWELVVLPHDDVPIATRPNCALRYEFAQRARSSGLEEPPAEHGRILFAAWTGGGEVPFDEQQTAIKDAVAGDQNLFDITEDVLLDVTMREFLEKLRKASDLRRPYTVLHILCHGKVLDKPTDTAGLDWLEGNRTIYGDLLADRLKEFVPSLRLVVLSACLGGYAGKPGNPMGSIADALHQNGIEAVISSRFPLSRSGSITFTKTFYSELIKESKSVDASLRAARSRLADRADEVSYWDCASLQLWSRDSAGWELRPIVMRPFRGLQVFHSNHATFFKGRGEAIERSCTRIKNAQTSNKHGFLVLAGASGVGKSSLVHAGIIPALREEDWTVRTVRPSDTTPVKMLDALLAERKQLEAEAKKLLIVVDQMEEIFTIRDTDFDAAAFVQNLWRLANTREVVVLAVIRVEFLARFGEVRVVPAGRRLDDAVFGDQQHELLWNLDQDGLRAAIEEPLRRVGIAVEPELVNDLLRDVESENGSLPLLQYVLDELWKLRTFDPLKKQYTLRREHYVAIDRIGGALSKRAKDFTTTLDVPQQNLVRRILLRLVDMRGEARSSTRRRWSMDRLRQTIRVDPSDFDAAIDRLEGAGLIVRSEGSDNHEIMVEIIHEQLVRSWPRLQNWLEADAVWLIFRTSIEEQADRWKRDGKPPGALLTKDYLARARSLLLENGNEAADISADAREFIVRSDEAEQRALADERAKNRRIHALMVLNGARALLAQGQRVQAGKLLTKIKTAERNSDWIGVANEVLHNPLPWHTFAGVDAQFAFQNSSALVITRQTADGVVLIMSAEGPVIDRFQIEDFFATKIAVDALGKRLLVGGRDGRVFVYELAKKSRREVSFGFDKRIVFVTFSGDGQRFIAVTEQGAIGVADRNDSFTLDPSPIGYGSPELVVMHPAGRALVMVWSKRGASWWKLEKQATPVAISGKPTAAAFAGDRVVLGYDDGQVRVWQDESTMEPKALRPFGDKSTIPISAMATVPTSSNATMIVGNDEGRLCRFSLDDGTKPFKLPTHSSRITTLEIGVTQHILAGGDDGSSLVFREDGIDTMILQDHRSFVRWARIHSHGGLALTSSIREGTSRLWNLEQRFDNLALYTHPYSPDGIWQSPDGRWLVLELWVYSKIPKTCYGLYEIGNPGSLRIVTENIQSLRFVTVDVMGSEFDPATAKLITLGGDGALESWTLTGTLERVTISRAPDVSGEFMALHANTREKKALVIKKDGALEIWDLLTMSCQQTLANPKNVELGTTAFDPAGTKLAAVIKSDYRILVWDLSARASEPIEVGGHRDFIRHLAWNPQGDYLVSASDDKTARIWSLTNRHEEKVFQGHTMRVECAAFSPDGRFVVTASEDGTARVFSVEDADSPIILQGHTSGLKSVQFGPDESVLSTSLDHTLRLWPLSISTLDERLLAANRDELPLEIASTYAGEPQEKRTAS